MSKQDLLSSNLSGGLIRDSHIAGTPPNSYPYALNLIKRDLDQDTFPSNEHSTRGCGNPPGVVVGAGFIDERNSTIFFMQDGSIQMVSHDDCSLTFVASDTEFGCDWGFKDCEWIEPETKVMQPCSELFIYWSSGCEYYWINLEEMLAPARKAALKESISQANNPNSCSNLDCEYFKVFRASCAPKLSPYSTTGGGQLKAGAYQFVVRYKNTEGGYSNWFNVSDPIYIGSDHNQAGEISSSAIEINLTGLDCSFASVEIAVIETIGGVTSAKTLGTFNFSSSNFNYTFFGNEGDPIDLQELFTKYNTLPRGRDLFQTNNLMLYYNIKQEKNLDWQRTVNNILTEYVVLEFTLEEAKKYNLKSFMGGETYAFGIVFNWDDGTHTQVFHIGCNNNLTTEPVPDPPPSFAVPSESLITTTEEGRYERVRTPIDETVHQTQNDDYDLLLQTLIDSYDTEVSDVCTTLEICEDCVPAADQCAQDLVKVDEIASDWLDILSSHGVDDLSVDFTPANIKESASRIIESIRQRERIIIEARRYEVDKSSVFYTGEQASHATSGELLSSKEIVYASQHYDVEGNPVTDLSPNIIDIQRTLCKEEEDILYPDTKNCEGEFVYGDLANTPVKHHTFPDRSVHSHFRSTSVGVPSIPTPDADEYSDGYVRLYGVRFSNILLPTSEESGKNICVDNPYTIVMVNRTKANRSIIFKGLATGTYVSSNQGKDWVFPKHAVNSFERINRYINIGGSRMQPDAPEHNSINVFSLDQLVYAPALVADTVRVERTLRGEGFRHHLYATGIVPEDAYYGSRIDQRGTVQAVNLSRSGSAFEEAPITFKIYAPNDQATSPPLGGTIPLMNRYNQESAWIGTNITKISDRSFVGDVLDHSAPVSPAQGQYVALVRDLPNQYGDLVSLAYVPIIQAGRNNLTTITALAGDVFVGPYSFVKTSYVSNKVGNLFPIGNLVPDKEPRSIKDSPEDVIHSTTGNWTPTTLPVNKDAADAKNWAGTHTTSGAGGISKTSTEALGVSVTESDYYYPRVLKTLITYWGEFEANPYLRQRGDTLETQYYNNIRSPWYLDSHAPDNHPWEESYLNQFYVEVTQPSKWAQVKKVLIRNILTILAPLIGLPALFDIESAADFTADMWLFPLIVALWAVMNKVLYTNDYLNKLVGITEPKTDDEGGEDDANIRNFFTNFGLYNNDYSKKNDFSFDLFGLPDPYYTCDCDDCYEQTTNQIFLSDRQIQSSQLDAYKTVRPNNVLTISSNYGSLTNIFSVGSALYAHTTDNIIRLMYDQVAIPSSAGPIQMGAGSFLTNPQALKEGIVEGFAGLKYTNAAINTQFGYFFVDSDASKIYQFNQEGLQEISSRGMFHFFKKYLDFCEPSDCIGEHVPGTSYYALGVDPRINRFLITKSDNCGSWTLSYDLRDQHWVSFHSYIPQNYIWDRKNLYSISSGFWVHDDPCNFQTFYGTSYPFIVEVPMVQGSPFTYYSSFIDTEARICTDTDYIYNRDITYNQLEMWNSWQTTGLLDLTVRTDSDCTEENAISKVRERSSNIEIVRENLSWRLNEIRDYIISHYEPFLTKLCPCHPYQTIINVDQCKDTNIQGFKNSIEIDNYLVTRLTFSNFTNVKLYTKSIAHYINNQVR